MLAYVPVCQNAERKLTNVIDANSLQDLSLYEVTYTSFGHDLFTPEPKQELGLRRGHL